MWVPSGEKVTEWMVMLCASSLSATGDDRSEASHTRSALSLPPVAMRLPSGEKATEMTQPLELNDHLCASSFSFK